MKPREARYHGVSNGELLDANKSYIADESWAGVVRCIPALVTKSPMDDRPMNKDDRSSFILSIEGRVNDKSCTLEDVSVRNEDSKIPALKLVILVVERGDDNDGRGE